MKCAYLYSLQTCQNLQAEDDSKEKIDKIDHVDDGSDDEQYQTLHIWNTVV